MTVDYAELSLILATSTHETLQENFPDIDRIKPEDWMYFVSIFSFRFFMEVLKQSAMPPAEQEKVFSENVARLKKEYPDFLVGFDDLNRFITPSTKPGDLGLWLAANLFKRNSRTVTEEELTVGVILGNIVANQVMSMKA